MLLQAQPPPPQARSTNVLLLAVPFGPLRQPSIGLELLRAALTNHAVQSWYLTIGFAERIGLDNYDLVTSLPGPLLVGEWMFRGALFGNSRAADRAFVEMLSAADTYHQPIAATTIEELLDIRQHIEPFLDDAVDRIVAERPRIVGLTSAFQQHVAALALAQRIKEAAPDVVVVLGGANCEGPMGAETLRLFPFVDHVVSGEADLTIASIVERLLAGRSVANIGGVFSRPDVFTDRPLRAPAPLVRDLDALPVPKYDSFFHQWNASAIASSTAVRLPIEFARGCWWGEKHHCTFCGLNGETMTYRSKSPRRAVDELRSLVEQHPCTPVTLVDNILDSRYFKDVLPELAGQEVGTGLFAEVKANLKKNQLQLLRDAGFTQIQPGIENLSSAVLRLMRKGVTGLQNIQTLKWAAEVGLQVNWNWLWGFPGEPPEEYQKCAEWIPLITHLMPPAWCGVIHLQRFSPNFSASDQLGFRNVEPVPAYAHVYPFDDLALRRLAYYFAYEYAEPRDLEAYTATLRNRIEEWRQDYSSSALFWIDDGVELRIIDLRPSAVSPLAALRGPHRSLYLYCDELHSVEILRRLDPHVPPHVVDEAIATLVGRGLMIRDGDHVLSLAVRGSDQADGPIARRYARQS